VTGAVLRYGAVAALAVLFASCATERVGLTLNTSAVPAEELVERVNVRANRLQAMTGKGSLAFESPQGAGSAYFTMALRKPDSLLVQFEGPFGLDVGLLFLSRQRFVMYNGLENQVVTGVPNLASIRAILPVELTFDQILNAFSGMFTLPRAHGQLIQYVIDDEQFLLSYVCGTDTCTYWVDPATQIVTRYLMQNAAGETLVEAHATRIEEQGDVCAPRRITVRLPDRQVSIYYSSLVLNDSHPSFAFSVPANAQTIER
jgi:hypothetical protein